MTHLLPFHPPQVRGAKLLAAGLKDSSSLEELYLAWAGIGDEGASFVAQALVDNSSLRVRDPGKRVASMALHGVGSWRASVGYCCTSCHVMYLSCDTHVMCTSHANP